MHFHNLSKMWMEMEESWANSHAMVHRPKRSRAKEREHKMIIYSTIAITNYPVKSVHTLRFGSHDPLIFIAPLLWSAHSFSTFQCVSRWPFFSVLATFLSSSFIVSRQKPKNTVNIENFNSNPWSIFQILEMRAFESRL